MAISQLPTVEELCEHIRQSNIQGVLHCLKKGTPIAGTDRQWTPLDIAIQKSNPEILPLVCNHILQNKNKPNSEHERQTRITAAIHSRDPQKLRAVLNNETYPPKKPGHPMMHAAIVGNLEIIEILANHGFPLNTSTTVPCLLENPVYPITIAACMAITQDRPTVLDWFTARGVDITQNKNEALNFAVSTIDAQDPIQPKQMAILKTLLDLGADPLDLNKLPDDPPTKTEPILFHTQKPKIVEALLPYCHPPDRKTTKEIAVHTAKVTPVKTAAWMTHQIIRLKDHQLTQ